MKFEGLSRFDINDVVYWVESGTLYVGRIKQVVFKTNQNTKKYIVKYVIKTPYGNRSREEKRLAKTLDEALMNTSTFINGIASKVILFEDGHKTVLNILDKYKELSKEKQEALIEKHGEIKDILITKGV